jgi:protein-disulfide isomerase
MTRVRLTILSALTCLAAACAPEGGDKAPQSVDRMARSEVEAIVKDYLINNPEVLSEAIRALSAHEQNKMVDRLASSDEDPSLGPKDAKITIIEFFDYNCGYCHAAYPWLFRQLDADTKDVRVIFKELPILAESSLTASKGALAADRQGKYREMHLALMRSKDLSEAGVEATAKSIGLDMKRFNADMNDESVMAHIADVARQSEEAGIRGTPGFFINGEFINGFDEAALERMIQDARKRS